MYDLSRNRFKELKHFCLQYHEMKEKLEKLNGKGADDIFDPTATVAVSREELEYAVKLIETTAFNLGNFPGETILEIVTADKSIASVCPYEIRGTASLYLKKFYWMLSKLKGL